MLTILGITSALLTVLIIVLIFYRHFAKGEPLLTWRNFFLAGYLQFYTVSVTHWSITQWQSPWYVVRGEYYGTLAATMVVFLWVFFLTYGWAFKWEWPGKVFPRVRVPMTNSACIVMITALTIAGLATLLIRGGSVSDNIVFFLRVPLASAAAGCATILVISNPRNPFWWAILIPVVMLGMLMSTVGSIDRRNFLSVIFVVVWVWYYASLRFQKPWAVFGKMGVVMAIGFVLLAMYNSVRQVNSMGGSFEGRLKQATELASGGGKVFSIRNIVEGILLQDTHVCTQAIMENTPDPWPYLPFHGFAFYFLNPIPRIYFPGKPEALGVMMQKYLQVPANLGVGCIGHGWAEMGWVGVLYYAVTLGAICAVADRLARKRSNDPFFLVTIGCSLGNVLGLARGETSLFMVLITVGLVSSLTVFYAMKLVLGPYMLVGIPLMARGRPVGEPIDEVTGLPLDDLDGHGEGGATEDDGEMREPGYDAPFGHDDPSYGRETRTA